MIEKSLFKNSSKRKELVDSCRKIFKFVSRSMSKQRLGRWDYCSTNETDRKTKSNNLLKYWHCTNEWRTLRASLFYKSTIKTVNKEKNTSIWLISFANRSSLMFCFSITRVLFDFIFFFFVRLRKKLIDSTIQHMYVWFVLL